MGQKAKKNRSADDRGVGRKPSDTDCVSAGANRSAGNSYAPAVVCVLLALAVFLVFGQTLGHEFVNYDDNEYVYDNPNLTHGLCGQSIAWAFTSTQCQNWHPLTWLSYLLDYQLYGLKPWGYHLTNVVLHAATAIALFLVLWRMTGDLWPSAFVAAAFAVHPLRAESVAWVAERKDVLSGLFFMLTLGAYAGYVRRPFSLVRYGLVIGLFALGLMAKPMLVTLPFVLLLLDYWPLDRMALGWRLLLEKLPLFALSAASCAITPLAQGHAVVWLDAAPLPSRIANAMVAYVAYVGQLFYPVGLAVFYPHRVDALAAWRIAGAVLLLAGICAAALVWRRRCPWLFAGWYWYLGMLVPVIGLMQVGGQSMADRYTYLPHIGLLVAVAWTASSLLKEPRFQRYRVGASSVAAMLILAVLMGCAWRQTSFWRNNELLWGRALVCTPDNIIAANNLAIVLREQGRLDEAAGHLRDALEVKPNDLTLLNNFALVLGDQGHTDEALAVLEKALHIQPSYTHAQTSVGIVMAKAGQTHEAAQTAEAVRRYVKAVELVPREADFRYNLGNALARQGRFDEAMAAYRKTLEIKPDHTNAQYNLGVALCQAGRTADGIAQLRELIGRQPEHLLTLNQLALVLATNADASLRNGAQAVELAERAAKLTAGREPVVLDTLAAAYAEAGQFSKALETANQALALAAGQNDAALAASLRARIRLYQAGSPYHDTQPSKPDHP